MQDTAKDILDAKIALKKAMEDFINTRGPNNPGPGGLARLYADHNFSRPPTEAELAGKDIKTRIAFRRAERVIELEAISMNDIHDIIVDIMDPDTVTPQNPGGDAFGSIANVSAWATNPEHGMGPVGANIEKTFTAWSIVRQKLGAFISPAMLADHSQAITGFLDSMVAQAGNIK